MPKKPPLSEVLPSIPDGAKIWPAIRYALHDGTPLTSGMPSALVMLGIVADWVRGGDALAG